MTMLPPTLETEQRSRTRANHHTLLILVDKMTALLTLTLKKVIYEITFLNS